MPMKLSGTANQIEMATEIRVCVPAEFKAVGGGGDGECGVPHPEVAGVEDFFKEQKRCNSSF